MGLRFLLCLLVVCALLASSLGQSQPEPKAAYQPPIAFGAPSIPIASSATLQNSYQPPISMIRSNEYQSPLNQIPPQQNRPPPPSSFSHPIPANAVPGTTYQSGPQTYVLQPQHHSVQYVPPQQQQPPQHSFSVFSNSFPQPATSYSVHQQPPVVAQGASASGSQGQSSSFSVLAGPPQQSTAERTYSSSSHSKVVGSSHVPAQAIHKAPASEIQGSKDQGLAAKEKDKSNDEYVVYYYYYYDNDTTAGNNNNLSLNFDDIPSLEAYDNDAKLAKEPEKSARAQLSANSLTASTETSSSSQPRSVGDAYGRGADDTPQPLKPVSNVFRYGSNEVPRFPVLPNFIVTEPPTTTRPEASTGDGGHLAATEPPTTQPINAAGQPDLKTGDEVDDDDDDSNNVLDNRGTDHKSQDDFKAEEEPTTTTTTTTTTTEPPTTTEEPTTTTERSRRRNPLGGGRRRFNPSPSSSFSSNRNRGSTSRSSSTSSTTSTTTSTTSAPTRRSFQGNRIRPRPPIGSNRPRPGSRTTASSTEAGEDRSESTTASTTTSSSSRSRFTSAAPRRFQSSRSRSSSQTAQTAQSSRTTSTSTTTTTTRSPISRSRSPSATRPRPNLISRNRPPRPGFLRPRPGSEPAEEPAETTTAAVEETSPVNEELPPSTGGDDNHEENETDEDNETSVDETDEEPTTTTTTEGNRFSALFRPRNRNALGNRPRPVIGNRPSRS